MAFNDVKKNVVEQIDHKEVAQMLGISINAMRTGLQQGLFPFGVAIKSKDYIYYCNKLRFEKWLKGEL